MKQTLTVLFLMIAAAGFSLNSKAPRYFLAEAHFEVGSRYDVVTRVIRANYFKEAIDIFQAYIKGIPNIKKWTDGRLFQISEIDFDKVLTK